MPRKKKKTSTPQPKKARPGVKRKQWSDSSMESALEAVKNGELSINRAAKTYDVPCSTLKDRISGRVIHGSKPGPSRYLDDEEEQTLSDHLVQVAKVGYGKTRKQVLSIVENVAREKDVLRHSHSNRVSDGWWRRFLERQPTLSLRRGDATAHVRMDATNKQSIAHYFNLLEETLRKIDNPAQIYNMDESGMPLDPRPPNIIAKRGQKKVRYRVSGKKEQITVIGCVNAIGQSIPPMVIFEGKYLNHLWTIDEVPGTYYGMSGKGWTDQELFRHWLMDHFTKYAIRGRPILLLLDGHSSHYEPVSVEMAQKEDIILFCLPPHTTQDSQPLDTSVFGPLKRHWSDVCHDYQQKNPGVVLTKFNFNKVFSKAWLRALTPSNIVSGFKKCGVHPFNRNAIPVSDESSDAEPHTKRNAAENNPTLSSDDSSYETPYPAETDTSGEYKEPNIDSDDSTVFTAEQIERFNRRHEEGYDLPDPIYEDWLKLNHPDAALCSSVVARFAAVPALDPVRSSESEGLALSESEGLALSVPSLGTDPDMSDGTATTVFSASTSAPRTSNISTPCSTTPRLPLSLDCDSNAGVPTAVSTPKVSHPTGTPTSSKKVSPVAKYLQVPEPVSKRRAASTSATRAITGARVLTSGECFAIIKEKERKKKQLEEEKEERKRLREEKKKQREEEKHQKEEEKAKRAEEKIRKAQEMEKKREEKERLKAEKEKQKAENEKQKVAKKQKGVKELDLRKRCQQIEPETSEKRPRLDDVIVSNRCCVCYQDYSEEEGVDWVQCPCTRWLHEDCIIDSVLDSSGKELLCPHCI